MELQRCCEATPTKRARPLMKGRVVCRQSGHRIVLLAPPGLDLRAWNPSGQALPAAPVGPPVSFISSRMDLWSQEVVCSEETGVGSRIRSHAAAGTSSNVAQLALTSAGSEDASEHKKELKACVQC